SLRVPARFAPESAARANPCASQRQESEALQCTSACVTSRLFYGRAALNGSASLRAAYAFTMPPVADKSQNFTKSPLGPGRAAVRSGMRVADSRITRFTSAADRFG